MSLITRANGDQKDFEVRDILKSMTELGIDSEVVLLAETSQCKPGDTPLPSFDDLSSVAASISYYFISPKLESEFNPMCGMKEVLENARFQDEVEQSILQLEEKIMDLEGASFLGKIEAALKANQEPRFN